MTPQENRYRMFRIMRELDVFTEQELIDEMGKDGGSLVIDPGQSIGECLRDISDIGALGRQNDYYYFVRTR